MPTTPAWSAATNATPGSLDGTNRAAQVGQELGTHTITPLYNGTPILTPQGGTQFLWLTYGDTLDLDQPFVLAGTSIGRIVLPVQANGNGADLRITLCPDNGSGSPNTGTVLASTTIPAEWLNATGATDGLENATGPLQGARYNTLYGTGSIQVNNWASAAGSAAGVAGNAGFTTSGTYMIFVGGSASGTAVPGVATAQYLGATSLAQPMTQPPLPQPAFYPSVTTTTSSVVVAGGHATSGLSNTWTASWDPNTGIIGSWSAQAALPSTMWGAGFAASGDTVYLAGGTPDGVTASRSVWLATVDNGQISGWQTGPLLPQATMSPCLTVLGGWLICAGGCTITATPFTNVWMARIAPDGTLGDWQAGPSLPVAVYSYAPGWDIATTDNEIVIVGGFTGVSSTTAAIQILPVTTDTIGSWRQTAWNPSNVQAVGAFDAGAGQWEIVNPVVDSSIYRTSTLTPVPLISVPLHAAGLTNGGTYHVVIQQHQSASAADYLAYGILDTALPLNALSHPRNTAGTWADAHSTWSVPMAVYDTSTTGGRILHTWEDPSSTGSTATSNGAARTSLAVYDTIGLLLGYCDATAQPVGPLNSNPTFLSGTAPWTATNGTLTQSSTHTQGGFAFSGLLTPTGGFASASAQTEAVPIGSSLSVVSNARWITANGWVYSPGGYSSVSLSVNWYDHAQALISASSTVVSVPAATWTNLVNPFLAPEAAAYATIMAVESGTPAATDVLYLSNMTLGYSPETTPVLSSVIGVDYDPATRLPVGTTQL